ncbi:hypothetical protein JCM11491_006931 [Sporobolomyces phaffii]
MAQVHELHIDTSQTSDLVVNPACFPRDACPGDLIAVRPCLAPGSKGKAKDSPLLYKIEHAADDSNAATDAKLGTGGVAIQRRRTAAAVTVSPTLAAAFGWVQNRIRVQLTLISSPPPPALCASHVELYFNNLYLSRPDSFVLALGLIGKVLHSNQRILLPGSGARLRVGDMWSSTSSVTSSRRRRGSTVAEPTQSNSHNLDSAYVTDSTKLIFRSESSRSYIFVEVSQEMWQFEEDGGMLVEKCEMFLEEVFAHYSGKMSKDSEDKRSKGIPTSHVVSVILYGRVIYDDREDAEEERAPLCQASDGTYYRDFFKVILDLTPSPSSSIIQTVASELRRWQELVLLRTRADGTEKLSGRLACAHESPVLEATNLALNSFEEHWIDRDLHRTGLEVIVLTAGSSFYQVDKQLLRLTTERMLYHGIGLDLISLSKMPLHSVPLFQFSSPDPAAAGSVQGEMWATTTEVGGMSVADTNGGGGGGVLAGAGAGGTGSTQRREAMPATSHKFDSLFINQQPPSSLHSANSPAALSSLSSRHPQLRHRRSMSSLRDVDRPLPSSPLREAHHPVSSVQQQHRMLPSTPQSILKPTESIHTSSGVDAIARDISTVPDDQRDPLYYDPLPNLKSHVAANASASAAAPSQHSRAPSTSTAPFPASATTTPHSTHSHLPSSPLPPPSVALALDSSPVPPSLPTSLYYSEPLFVFPHFFGTQPDKPHRVDRFMPRARCYELFSQGLGERVPLALPLLKHDPAFAGITTTMTSAAGPRGDHSEYDVTDENYAAAEAKRGYLDEMEQKLRRRELFDAAALGVQDLDPATADEVGGTAKAIGGGGHPNPIVIGRKGNWGAGRATGSGGELDEGRESGVSEGVSTGESLGGHGSESTSISGGERDDDYDDGMSSHGSLSERSVAGGGGGDSRRASRNLTRKESESEGDDGGFGIGMPSVMLAAAQSDARHSRQHRAGSISTTASSTHEGEPDRGRQSSRKGPAHHVVPLPSNDSGGRSKTPVPKHRRKERDSSVAASVRTAGSIKGSLLHTATNRKASTPALIARLTGGPPPPRADPPDLPASSDTAALTSPPKATIPLPRPSWLSLFSRTNSSSSTATVTPSTVAAAAPPSAPQVAVARVDVQASLKPEAAPSSTAGSVTGSPVLSSTSISERRSSATRDQVEAELAVAASDSSRAQPSQPITIGSRDGLAGKRTDDRGKPNEGPPVANSKKRDGAPSGQISGSLKAYEPGEAMRKGLGKGGRISVAARFNPSKPGKRSVGLADQARRWAGILVVERKNMRLGVKWRSITRGASLPITTDYIPSSDVLSSQYSEYRYSVPTNSVTSSFLLRPDHPKRSHILTLVTELICQRLSHGFQIYTPAPSRSNPDSSKTLPDVLQEIQNGETTAVYLSLSNQVHRIWYDRRSKSVFVKILRRRRTWAKPEYHYQPLIWTQGADRADVTPLTCPYPSMVDPVEWQHADRLVAGAESHEANQTVRYRSTRLVLLPASKIPDRDYIIGRTKALQVEDGEQVTDQMIQEQGFYTLLDLIESARWSPSGVEKAPISIHQTTLDAPSWAASIARPSTTGQLSSTTASPALVPVQPAVARAGWLSRMQSKSGREDSQPSTPMIDRDLDLSPPTPNPPALSLPESIATSFRAIEEPSKRPLVKMTHAVVLDLDPSRRSERAERVICHLDRSHNAQAAYHIELAWLTASGKTVDTAIQAWMRQMARYGITLVEVSTKPVLARHNPFQKPTVIRPVIAPPASIDEDAPTHEQYLAHVLRTLDYFLDLGADSTFPPDLVAQYSYRRSPVLDSQYIHRSGAAIVSVVLPDSDSDDDAAAAGFAYVPNRIFTSHHAAIDEAGPARELDAVCRDAARLSAIWTDLDHRHGRRTRDRPERGE